MEKVKFYKSKKLMVVLLLVGNESVEKTTIIMKLLKMTPQSQELLSASLGGETSPEQSSSRPLQTWWHAILVDGKLINVILWDPVGCNSVSNIYASYVALADAVIIMFDCTVRSTYSAIVSWHRYIRKSAVKDTSVFILGTNFESRRSTVNLKEVRKLSRTLCVMKTFLLMPKTESKVEDVLRTIIQRVMYQRQQKEVVARQPGVSNFSTRRNRWNNFQRSVRSIVHAVVSRVRPRYNAYRPLTQQEEKTSSEMFEEGGHVDPQTGQRGQSSRSGHAFFSKTPHQTEVKENEDNVTIFLPSPSTSGATSQTQQHIDSSTLVSVSPQRASYPVASTSHHQNTTEVREVSTVTVQAEVHDHRRTPKNKSKSSPLTENFMEMEFEGGKNIALNVPCIRRHL